MLFYCYYADSGRGAVRYGDRGLTLSDGCYFAILIHSSHFRVRRGSGQGILFFLCIVIYTQLKGISGMQERRRLGKDNTFCCICLDGVGSVICAIVSAGKNDISSPLEIIVIIFSLIGFISMCILCDVCYNIKSLAACFVYQLRKEGIITVCSHFFIRRIAIAFFIRTLYLRCYFYRGNGTVLIIHACL